MERKKKIGGPGVWLLAITALCWFGLAISGKFHAWWPWGLIPIGLTVYAFIRTARQKVSTGRHPNMHYPDIAENSDPMTMSDGTPIIVMLFWYAATRGISREDASEEIGNMNADDFAIWEKRHRDYLKQFEN